MVTCGHSRSVVFKLGGGAALGAIASTIARLFIIFNQYLALFYENSLLFRKNVMFPATSSQFFDFLTLSYFKANIYYISSSAFN